MPPPARDNAMDEITADQGKPRKNERKNAQPSSRAPNHQDEIPVKSAKPIWKKAAYMMQRSAKRLVNASAEDDKKAVSVAMLGKLKIRALEARETTKQKHSFWNRIIIEPDGSIRIIADLVSVILLVYTIFEIPFTIIFLDSDGCSWDWRVYLNLVADVVFLSEIVLNFNTAYYSEEAMILVKDRRAIAVKYFKGWFYIDISSSLPLEHIMCGVGAEATNSGLVRAVKFLRFLKLARIAKFMRVLRKWELHSGSRIVGTSVRIIKFVALMVMSAHLCGCLWMLLIDLAGCQIPMDADAGVPISSCSCTGDDCQPLNWMVLYDPVLADDDTNDTSASKYLLSLYFTIMTLATVGYGDIAPTNDYERLYAVLLAMLGAMVFAFCIGSISNLATEGNRFEMILESTQREVTDFMHFRGVPKDLQMRVRKHVNHTAKRAPHLVHPCLNLLPRSLRNEVIESVSKESVAGIKWFEHMDADFRSQLLGLMRPLALRPKEYLFRALDSATEMYIVVRGVLEVWDLDERLVVAKLGEGDVVGEIGLLEDALPYRTATVTARTECELLELQREDFHRHIKPLYPDAYQAIKELGEVRLKHLFLPDKLRAKFRAVSLTRTGTLREWKDRFLKSRAAVATASREHAIIGTTVQRPPPNANLKPSARARSVSAFEPGAISITALHREASQSPKPETRELLAESPIGSVEMPLEDEETPEDEQRPRRRFSLPYNMNFGPTGSPGDPPAGLELDPSATASLTHFQLKGLSAGSTGNLNSARESGSAQAGGQKRPSTAGALPGHAEGNGGALAGNGGPGIKFTDSPTSHARHLQAPLAGRGPTGRLLGLGPGPGAVVRTDTQDSKREQRLNANGSPNLNDLAAALASAESPTGRAGAEAELGASQLEMQDASAPRAPLPDAPPRANNTTRDGAAGVHDECHGDSLAERESLHSRRKRADTNLKTTTGSIVAAAEQEGHVTTVTPPAGLSHADSHSNLKQAPSGPPLLRPLPQHASPRSGSRSVSPLSRASSPLSDRVRPLPGAVEDRGWSQGLASGEAGGPGPAGSFKMSRAQRGSSRGVSDGQGVDGGGGGGGGLTVSGVAGLLEGMERRLRQEVQAVRHATERQVGELQREVALLRGEVAELKAKGDVTAAVTVVDTVTGTVADTVTGAVAGAVANRAADT